MKTIKMDLITLPPPQKKYLLELCVLIYVSHSSFVFTSLTAQNLFPLNWVWPSELIGLLHFEHEYSFRGFFSLVSSPFISFDLFLHSIFREIFFGYNF